MPHSNTSFDYTNQDTAVSSAAMEYNEGRKQTKGIFFFERLKHQLCKITLLCTLIFMVSIMTNLEESISRSLVLITFVSFLMTTLSMLTENYAFVMFSSIWSMLVLNFAKDEEELSSSKMASIVPAIFHIALSVSILETNFVSFILKLFMLSVLAQAKLEDTEELDEKSSTISTTILSLTLSILTHFFAKGVSFLCFLSFSTFFMADSRYEKKLNSEQLELITSATFFFALVTLSHFLTEVQGMRRKHKNINRHSESMVVPKTKWEYQSSDEGVEESSKEQIHVRGMRTKKKDQAKTKFDIGESDSLADEDEEESSPSNPIKLTRMHHGLSKRQKKNRRQSHSPETLSKKKGGYQPLKIFKHLNLNEQEIYEYLLHYVHEPRVLLNHGFPRAETSFPSGQAYIFQGNIGITMPDHEENEYSDHANSGISTTIFKNMTRFPSTNDFPKSHSSDSPRNDENVDTWPGNDKNDNRPFSTTLHWSQSNPTFQTGPSPQSSPNFSRKNILLRPTAEEFVPKGQRNNLSLLTPRTAPSSPVMSHKRSQTLQISQYDITKNRDVKECLRCHKYFHVDKDGVYTDSYADQTCYYHWGKIRMRTYQCCRKKVETNPEPCEKAQRHVWKGIRNCDTTIYLDGFVTTKWPKRDGNGNSCGIYALDAEMAFTAFGLELIRISVVGSNGVLVYEAYVKPEHEIIDYNTRYSGIDERILSQKANKTLKEVQNDLMGFINAGTILIGHGLENDLRVLKMVHNNVIDTSIHFMEKHGMRTSLKNLTKRILGKEIQRESQMGHDSCEDARACMELMLWKISRDFMISSRKKKHSKWN